MLLMATLFSMDLDSNSRLGGKDHLEKVLPPTSAAKAFQTRQYWKLTNTFELDSNVCLPKQKSREM